MSKHPVFQLNEVRAFAYFSQGYWQRVLMEHPIPNPERIQTIVTELQQVVLSLIPDDDEDTPGMRR